VREVAHRSTMSISALIFDFRVASNAKIIPQKIKKDLSDPDISFLGHPFYEILTFESFYVKRRKI
tara:strand:- start:147 stop:341 length:195 start_codon:yes stop_codon:yes gene_type:complete